MKGEGGKIKNRILPSPLVGEGLGVRGGGNCKNGILLER
jgi:hypothetical protein